ncbi:MAG: glycosyltransferase family A protein [Candidatus Omnitrophota bacterium]|nr:glycosyltransferase family A protein [Candidatus Omnitrophota bacterium]
MDRKVEIIEGLVSTVIPVYNRPDMLKEAVQSVLDQTYRPIEIIIADDGSGEEVFDVAGELEEKHSDIIKYIRLGKNQGPGPAREAGRKLAKGEFIQYLDSDDLLMPGKFELQVRALRDNPDCGIAYGYTKLVGEDGEGADVPFKWTGKRMEKIFPGLLVDRWWCTDTPLYRRSVCDEIGPWSDLRWSQDWEYDARAGALKTKLVHCREFVSKHRGHGGIRQTLPADWCVSERALARVQFLKSLYRCAQKAGVTAKDKEMRHFSRWMFLIARRAGYAGLTAEAKECFDIAREACGLKRAAGWDFRIYKVLTGFLGWKLTGKVFYFLVDRVKGRNPGKDTLKQSWME